jgi:hypothetical protein
MADITKVQVLGAIVPNVKIRHVQYTSSAGLED